MEGTRETVQCRACKVSRRSGSATTVVFFMRLVLGWRLGLVYSSHGVVLLLKVNGLVELEVPVIPFVPLFTTRM